MFWLLMQSTLNDIVRARESKFTLSEAQSKEFTARFMDSGSQSLPRIMTVAGDTAQINITGVLTRAPDIFAYYFGGGNTTYNDIMKSVALAENDPNVKQIAYFYDSPGGNVDGMYEAIDAIQSGKKPKSAIIRRAASAAYGLASVSGTMEAANIASSVGSLGVATERYVDENIVTLTSTNAPNKRPDVTTAEGKAAVVKELDAVENMFFNAIASGRGVTVDKIIADFGKGGMFLAEEALKRGMIDKITPKSTANSGNKKGVHAMDLETLKAQHPAVYAAAVNDGVKKERDRVSAHVIAGKAANDVETALSAIESGDEMTAVMTAKYLAAGIKNQKKDDRRGDDAAAAAALAAAGSQPTEPTQDAALSKVVDIVAAELGSTH